MNRTAACVAAALALLFGRPVGAQTTAFVDGRVIDGAGRVTDHGTVIVKDGVIVDAGPAETIQLPKDATLVSLHGKTLMPGIVNGHGHLAAANGLRSGPELYTRENLERSLRVSATYGITSVFALGDDREEAFALRAAQSEGPPGRARVFLAGPSIAATTAEMARDLTDKTIALEPDLIKIRIDDNLGATKKMPEVAWRAVLQRAHEAHLKLAVHLYYLEDAKAVADAGADFIVHSVRDLPVDGAFLRSMRTHGTCYSPTLMREVSTFLQESTPAWVNDPFFRRGYPEGLAAELSDPERQAKFRATPVWANGQKYKVALQVAKANLKRVSDAGIPVVMGTDSGPAGRFNGFFEQLELEMMVDSGLSPMQAIVAATGTAASCWGKAGQIGTIAKGLAADLLVLNANPLEKITNTRAIEAIYIGGRRFDPPFGPR
jgi:imidazolonepropionase-like amidohydrolase